MTRAPQARAGARHLLPGSWAWIGVLALLCIVRLPDHGVTWDVEQTMFYGHRYFDFWRTLDPRFLDFEVDRWERKEGEPDLEASRRERRISAPHFVWPLAHTLAAGCERLFYRRLHWLPPIAAHHVLNVVLCALACIAAARYLKPRIGAEATLVFIVALWLAPAWLGNLSQNLRDVPVTCLSAVALFLAASFLEAPGRWKAVGIGVVLGLALGSKITAASLFAIVAPAAVYALARVSTFRWRHVFLLLVGSGAIAVLVFVISWPWLWIDSIRKVGQWNDQGVSWITSTEHWSELALPLQAKLRLHFEDFLQRQVRLQTGGNLVPLLEMLATTPPTTLLLAVLGLFSSRWVFRRGQPVLVLIAAAWWLLPLLRMLLPGSASYGGIRHFLEFWPGLCLCATLGFVRLRQSAPRIPGWACWGILVSWPLLAALISHPFGMSYNSLLVGGNRGGRALGLSSSFDFWGGSLHQGVRLVNARAGEGSVVVVPSGRHLVQFTAPCPPHPPRPDLDLAAVPLSSPPDDRRECWVLQLLRPHLRDHVDDLAVYAYCESELDPVHLISLGGAPLLRIYRILPEDGGAGALKERANRWFGEREASWIKQCEERLLLSPQDLGELEMLFRLRTRHGLGPEALDHLRPFVKRAFDALPSGFGRERLEDNWNSLQRLERKGR